MPSPKRAIKSVVSKERRRANIERVAPPVRRLEDAIERCDVFLGGKLVDRNFDIQSAIEEVEEHGDGYLWLSLISPTTEQMAPVAEALGINSLTVEDIVTAHQRPKLDQMGDYVFIVAHNVDYDPNPPSDTSEFITTNEVQMVVGRNFVVTIQHGSQLIGGSVRRRIENSQSLANLGPMTVAYAVIDWLVDDYLYISQRLERKLDAMESEVFTPHTPVRIEPIYMLKREILEMRHALDPLTNVLRTLTTTKDISRKTLRSYYRDVLDHHITSAERVSGYDERLSSLIDAAVAKVSLQQNTDMRKISAWVAIAAVPTMIAGIYGMNFENMPELSLKYGYYMILAVMVLSCFGLWYVFRKNKWL